MAGNIGARASQAISNFGLIVAAGAAGITSLARQKRRDRIEEQPAQLRELQPGGGLGLVAAAAGEEITGLLRHLLDHGAPGELEARLGNEACGLLRHVLCDPDGIESRARIAVDRGIDVDDGHPGQGREAPDDFIAALQAASGKLPTWNFGKYLVGRDGKVVRFFPSNVEPDSSELVSALEAALGAKSGS